MDAMTQTPFELWLVERNQLLEEWFELRPKFVKDLDIWRALHTAGLTVEEAIDVYFKQRFDRPVS